MTQSPDNNPVTDGLKVAASADESSLSVELQEVDALCDQFESEWQAGHRPSIAEYLGERRGEARRRLFRELLLSISELSPDAMPSAVDLRAHFPDMIGTISEVYRLNDETRLALNDSTFQPDESFEGDSLGDPPDALGRYRLVRPLGQGSMGTVYLAIDNTLQRQVALKLPRFDRMDGSSELVARFYREARTMAAISHRNLCTIHDVSQINGFHCLTMEFVDGQPLSQVLSREGRLEPQRAARLIRAVCRGIQLAHNAGVVHRDIKPSNIMIDADGQPVLTDFGLARRLAESPLRSQLKSSDPHSAMDQSSDSTLTLAGVIVGTPGYMAPEQADETRTDGVGPHSDVYSLGVVLYHMLTGRVPFTGTVSEVLKAIRHEAPALPSEHCPGIDPRLERLCLTALEKDPAHRFATAADFASGLDDWLSSTEATPARHSSLVRLGVAAGLLVVVAFIVQSLRIPSGSDKEDRPSTTVPPIVVTPPATPLIDSAQLFELGTQEDAAFADIDLDDDLDLIIVGRKENPGRILLNSGDGRFRETPHRLGIGRSLAVGDLDNDGDPDAIVAGGTSPDTVWLNDGHGVFASNGQQLDAGHTQHVSLGDLDGDGDLDAFVAVSVAAPMHNRVYLNDGTGTFTRTGQLLGENWTIESTLADVDGDGDLDAITANLQSQPDAIWLNDGSGEFIESEQQFPAASTATLAAADLDNDGDTDLLFAGRAAGTEVWTNDGLGNFVNSRQTFNLAAASGLSLVDLDDDGDLDVIAANRGLSDTNQTEVGAPNAVWWNNGRGQFTSSWQFGEDATNGIAIGDIDADGDSDLFELNGGDESVCHLLLNQSVPSPARFDDSQTWPLTDTASDFEGPLFVESGQRLGRRYSTCVSLGDLDGDGALDAIVGTSLTSAPEIYWNDGNGEFQSRPMDIPESLSRVISTALGDLDGDGDLDIYLARSNNLPDMVVLNDGTGSFSLTKDRLGQAAARDVALGDVDGDGDLDAYVTTISGHSNLVCINDGTGRFHLVEVENSRHQSHGVALADFDRDGDLDALIAAVEDEPETRIWWNDGTGQFTPGELLLDAPMCRSVAASDLDQDGDIDAIVSADAPWGLIACLNTSSGWQIEKSQEPRRYQWGLAVADMDGDSFPDVVTAVNRDGKTGLAPTNRLWINDGAGRLGEVHDLPGARSTLAVATGDLDGDGDNDIFEANALRQPDIVILNELTER